MKKTFFILAFIAPILAYTQPKSCNVSFVYSNEATVKNIKFVSRTIDTNNVVSWHWDFGDGYSSSLQNPKHEYLQHGNYYACLTIITIDSCENTFCDTIKIGPTASYFSIIGNVYAGSAPLPSGIVLLIDVNNNYKAKKYSFVNNGHYEFNQLQPSNYIIYAIPNFNIDVNYYPTYLPTYLGTSTKWQNAGVLNLTNSLINQNINLACNTDILYGPDTISGKIKILDANSFEYNIYYNNWFGNLTNCNINLEIAPNMPVLLLNSEDEPVRFAMTDSSGKFIVKNLPIDIYKIAPEKAGLNTIPYLADFTTTSTSNINTNIYIATSNIYSYIPETINNKIDIISVFPNPISENAIVQINTQKQTQLIISIENIEGKILLTQKFVSQGNEKYFLPFSNLPNGIYFIKIKSENSSILVKKIIKQ